MTEFRIPPIIHTMSREGRILVTFYKRNGVFIIVTLLSRVSFSPNYKASYSCVVTS